MGEFSPESREQFSPRPVFPASSQFAPTQQEGAFQSGPALEAPRAVAADAPFPDGAFCAIISGWNCRIVLIEGVLLPVVVQAQDQEAQAIERRGLLIPAAGRIYRPSQGIQAPAADGRASFHQLPDLAEQLSTGLEYYRHASCKSALWFG